MLTWTSRHMFSKCSDSKFGFLLDGMSDCIKDKIPPPFLVLSRLCTLYLSTTKRLSLNVQSNFTSAIDRRSTIFSVNSSLIASNLYLRLLIFIYDITKFFGCFFFDSLNSLCIHPCLFTPEMDYSDKGR